MVPRIIPQRDLRNNITDVLRQAEAGVQFTITVHGRPVASLGPMAAEATPRTDVDAATVARVLSATPVDDALATDIARLRELEAPVDDPWPTHEPDAA